MGSVRGVVRCLSVGRNPPSSIKDTADGPPGLSRPYGVCPYPHSLRRPTALATKALPLFRVANPNHQNLTSFYCASGLCGARRERLGYAIRTCTPLCDGSRHHALRVPRKGPYDRHISSCMGPCLSVSHAWVGSSSWSCDSVMLYSWRERFAKLPGSPSDCEACRCWRATVCT